MNQHISHIEADDLRVSRKNGSSFGRNSLSIFIGLSFESVIFLNSSNKSSSAVGFSQVFSSDVQTLSNDSVSDLLLHNDSQGFGVDVEDLSCSSMVEQMGHSCVDGSINHDIHVLSDSNLLQIVLHSDGTVTTERS